MEGVLATVAAVDLGEAVLSIDGALEIGGGVFFGNGAAGYLPDGAVAAVVECVPAAIAAVLGGGVGHAP